MTTSRRGPGQLIAGAGGVLLIVSLFLPWADADGASVNGWELSTMADVFFLIGGCIAILAALTGGHVGVFRSDLSVNGATDLLGLVGTTLIAWLILFDFPEGASREIGVFLALLGAMTMAGGVGQYRMPHGGWFPATTPDGGRR